MKKISLTFTILVISSFSKAMNQKEWRCTTPPARTSTPPRHLCSTNDMYRVKKQDVLAAIGKIERANMPNSDKIEQLQLLDPGINIKAQRAIQSAINLLQRL